MPRVVANRPPLRGHPPGARPLRLPCPTNPASRRPVTARGKDSEVRSGACGAAGRLRWGSQSPWCSSQFAPGPTGQRDTFLSCGETRFSVFQMGNRSCTRRCSVHRSESVTHAIWTVCITAVTCSTVQLLGGYLGLKFSVFSPISWETGPEVYKPGKSDLGESGRGVKGQRGGVGAAAGKPAGSGPSAATGCVTLDMSLKLSCLGFLCHKVGLL